MLAGAFSQGRQDEVMLAQRHPAALRGWLRHLRRGPSSQGSRHRDCPVTAVRSRRNLNPLLFERVTAGTEQLLYALVEALPLSIFVIRHQLHGVEPVQRL